MERGAVDRVDANRQSHDQCTRHQSARGTQSTEGAQKRRTVSFGHLKGALTRATMSPRRSTVFRPPTLISTENADDAQFPAIQGCLTHGRVKYNSARYENRETFGPAGAGSGDPRPTVVDCRHQVVVLRSGRVAGGLTSVIARKKSAAMSVHVRRRNCSAKGTVRRR